jgi:hypothetical protein
MNIIVTTLKMKLGAHGWAETLRRDKPREFAIPVGEVCYIIIIVLKQHDSEVLLCNYHDY